VTSDTGLTWEVQPSATGKVLQAVVYRGGRQLWVAGRGGTILKRSEPLSPVQTAGPKRRPTLLPGVVRKRPTPRAPLLTVPDDGDIPLATPPKKPA